MTAAVKARPAADPWVPVTSAEGGCWRRLSDGSIGALVTSHGQWCIVRLDGLTVIPPSPNDWKRAADFDAAKLAADVALGLADPPPKSTGRMLAEFVAAVVVLPASFVLWAWGLSRLWAHNLVPFGLPEIGTWRMLGLLLCVGAVKLYVTKVDDSPPTPTVTLVQNATMKAVLLLMLVWISGEVTA